MELTAIIIEDEQKGREVLKNLLLRFCSDVKVVGEAITVKQSVEIIQREKPDVVFLDIELPQQLGFALLDYFPSPEFAIIFTTAYDDFAVQAFRISAVDYLLKPINFQLLQKAVEKVRLNINRSQRSNSLEVLSQNVKWDSFRKVAIPISNGLKFVDLENIVYCKADRNYTYFYMKNGDKYIVSKPLRYYEDVFSGLHFFRINRSIIINIQMLQSYARTKSGEIILETGDVFTISESKKQNFLEHINYR